MQMGQGTGRRAMAERRKFCRRHIAARVVGRLHVRGDDAKRAAVEYPRDFGGARHAHQRGDAGLKRGDADLARDFERKARMLQIDIEAVETRGLGDAGDLDPANEPYRHRGDDLAAGKLRLDMVVQ